MYSKFENLSQEKRKKIIDVCIDEFSQNGYVNASTNIIVKNAEISKGILFHYFGNKKSLYLYVFDYVADFISEIMFKRMTDLPADFFERIMKIGIIKLKVAYEYPEEYKFLIDAVTHTAVDLKHDVQIRYEKMYNQSIPLMYNDIDTSRFRSDIDRKKATEFIMFALEGMSSKYFKVFESMSVDEIMSQMEKITQDFNDYIEILKYGVYGQQ